MKQPLTILSAAVLRIRCYGMGFPGLCDGVSFHRKMIFFVYRKELFSAAEKIFPDMESIFFIYGSIVFVCEGI